MPDLQYTFRTPSACNMCGADQSQFQVMGMRLNQSQGFRPKTRTGIAVGVSRCRSCGLIFADPQPVPRSLEDHYGEADEYWSEDYYRDDLNYFSEEVDEAQSLLPQTTGLRALDIGAGIGKAMDALSRVGFDCVGIEPSESFRNIAISRGILADRLVHTSIEDAQFDAGSFDYITFGAVLEHLFSPGGALSLALGWLKPGGIIQAEVPSSRYFMSKLTNAYFALRGTNYVTNISPMHPPYHLFEFDLASFQLHGRRAGYEVAKHRFGVGGISNLPKIVHPPLQWLMKATNTGMVLTVHLRKTVVGASDAEQVARA